VKSMMLQQKPVSECKTEISLDVLKEIVDIRIENNNNIISAFNGANEERGYKLPLANAKAYDLIMELHLNASESPNARGFEVLYKTEKGKAYARPIADCLAALFTPRGDKGLVKRDNLYMLNATKAPAIML